MTCITGRRLGLSAMAVDPFNQGRTLGAGRHDTRELWARKGELLTCASGHVIAEVMRDIRVGDKQQPGDWGRRRDPEPASGTPVPILCCICGEPWVTMRNGGMVWRIGGAWRGSPDSVAVDQGGQP